MLSKISHRTLIFHYSMRQFWALFDLVHYFRAFMKGLLDKQDIKYSKAFYECTSYV